MNDQQPGTSTASIFFDSFLFSHDGSHAIPDTLANAIPETTPDAVEILAAQDTIALPVLRLPQIVPAEVIAMRQRSMTPMPYLQSKETMHSHPDKMKHKLIHAVPGVVRNEIKGVPQAIQTPRSFNAFNTPVTPFPDATYRNASKIPGITYIPRSMTRHTEPTVVDALIACGTLILLCLCVLLFLYYVGL